MPKNETQTEAAPQGSPDDQTFPKSNRLRKSAEFIRVYRGNCYAANDCLVIQAAPNPLGVPRIGLSVSRKVGNAVVRNRWKRLIREAFRLQKNQLPQNLDLVVRPRKGAQAEFQSVKRSLRQLAMKLQRKITKGQK